MLSPKLSMISHEIIKHKIAILVSVISPTYREMLETTPCYVQVHQDL